MSETDFAGFRQLSTADKRRLADGVMRKAKRSRAHDAGMTRKQTGDAVDLRNVERFAQHHCGQNRQTQARRISSHESERSSRSRFEASGTRTVSE